MIKDNQHFDAEDEKKEKKDFVENSSENYLEDDIEDDLDDEEYQGEAFSKVKQFLLKNKKTLLIAAGVIALIIIVAVTGVILGRKGSSNNSSASVLSIGQTNSIGTTGGSESATKGENPSVEVIAAEVAKIDDPQDPQAFVDSSSKGSGALVNATDMKNVGNGTSSNGIDVSKFQGKIDWSAVAATGIDFAMIRVGYRTTVSGVIYEDPYAMYNMQKAAEAGIKVGAYFFSSAISNEEVMEEAAWTTNYIAKYSITYPVAFDCEGYNESDSRMKGISSSARTALAVTFLNYISNAGYEPMFYSSKSEIENSNSWDMSRINAVSKVWVAQYPSTPYPSTAKSDYSGSQAIWQYTNKGVVNGINGYVDMNVAYFNYGTVAQAKDTSGVINADNPELGMTFSSTNDQVTAKIETNLRSLPSTGGDIVVTIKSGEFVTRIGIGDKGWSKLSYNGRTVYAVTSLLTNEVPATTAASPESGITFTAASDQVTAKDEVNLRTSPSTSGSLVILIKNGTYLSRTGIGDNGWSRLIYNGQTVYALTSYLTTQTATATVATTATTAPVTTTAASTVTMTFTDVNEQVTAKSETNLRDKPSTDTGVLVVTIKNGTYVKRTGINTTTGWSKLEYNGKIVYAVNSMLVTK